MKHRLILFFVFVWVSLSFKTVRSQSVQPTYSDEALARINQFFENHCIGCHSGDSAERGFDIDSIALTGDALSAPSFQPLKLEQIIRRVMTRQMPPADSDRPDEEVYRQVVEDLNGILTDRYQWKKKLTPVDGIRRLTRIEYQNSIRDLFGIEFEITDQLPEDPSSHGFDNVASIQLSPKQLSQYLLVAEDIARQLVGRSEKPSGVTVRLPADRSQEEHVAGLPFGTRGGTAFRHRFPRSGIYEFEMKLTRDRDEKVEGLNRKHDIDLMVDRKRVKRFTVEPPKSGMGHYKDYSKSDAHLKTRVRIEQGEHEVVVTFPKISSSLVEDKRQPFDANFNRHRHPRKTPALFQVTVVGPVSIAKVKSKSASIPMGGSILGLALPAEDAEPDVQRRFVRRLMTDVMNRAYRRPITEADFISPMRLYDLTRKESSFTSALEMALASALVNPNFLLRVENVDPNTSELVRLNDFELATRLAYFLWSSLPDQRLLDLAKQGKLSDDVVLESEVDRMLADRRSNSLVSNFASQWLYLRNLDSITPDLRAFPDFDDNLRQSFRKETELLFQEVIANDHSVLKLVASDATYLNARLAKHYGIEGVQGSHFRRIQLPPNSRRGGILRHGSILMLTSYATRTSPTIRGNWILDNLIGTPPPPPPPNIPNLEEKTMLNARSIRQRLELHRKNPACASCHDIMDPIGFALENYDAVGRWRQRDGELPIDSKGATPSGDEISSVEELEQNLIEHPEMFVQTLTEKLSTFALGRSVDEFDGPEIRRILKDAGKQEYRFSAVIKGIVRSDLFRLVNRSKPPNLSSSTQ